VNRLVKITLIILLLINFSITKSLSAAESDIRYYDVELIIFENTSPKYQQSEHWKKSLIQSEPENYVQIGQELPLDFPEQYDPLLSFQYIENTNYRLNDIVTSLNESNLYRIILHSAWRQPGLSKSEAINVKINHIIPTQSNNIDDQTNEQNLNTSNMFITEQADIDEQETASHNEIMNTNKTYVLSGYVKLILSRYLHLQIDLIYHEMQNDVFDQFTNDVFIEESLLPDIFHIQQTRRLRSKELHYIDHPVISIIALITPYKIKTQ